MGSSTIKKHAYLIIAHNEFDILEKLIMLLDDERNDLYLHIDKKVQNFPFQKFKNLTKKSSLFFVKRIKCFWGDYSLVKCELILLKAAVKKDYQYYHLISGVDIPLKSNNYIHEFFKQHNGEEFVHFCTKEQYKEQKTTNRINRYFFENIIWNYNQPVKFIAQIFYYLQQKKIIKRKIDPNTEIKYGSQWFSITHKLAKYIVKKKRWIRKHFILSNCSDELFLQTLVHKSSFRNNIYIDFDRDGTSQNLRLIDWERGGPYVFREEDFIPLISSNNLFARKFSTDIDKEIVEKLYSFINENNY